MVGLRTLAFPHCNRRLIDAACFESMFESSSHLSGLKSAPIERAVRRRVDPLRTCLDVTATLGGREVDLVAGVDGSLSLEKPAAPSKRP